MYFLKSKEENAATIDSWIVRMNNNSGETVKTLFTDNGKEFVGQSEYNGMIEKRLHIIIQIARTLLHQSGLAKQFWAESVRLATYLTNRMPTSKLGITPYQAWTGELPDLSNIHIFGSKGQVLVEGKHLTKFNKRTQEMIYLGPALTNQGHRMWNPTTNSIIESRNVRFLEEEEVNTIVTPLPILFHRKTMKKRTL